MLDGPDGRVLRLGDPGGSHVTAGLYWLPERRPWRRPTGFARLRDYLRWLTEQGRVFGVVLPLVFDVDRARDISAAEAAGLARGNGAEHQRLLGHLPRAEPFAGPGR